MGIVAAFVNPALNFVKRYVYVCFRDGPYMKYIVKGVPLILRDVDGIIAVTTRSAQPVYLNASNELVTVCTFLSIILTFGVLFPPVALTMLIAMYSVVYTTKIKVGMVLSAALNINESCYADIIDLNCHGVGTMDKLNPCVKQLVFTSCSPTVRTVCLSPFPLCYLHHTYVLV